MRSNSSLDQPFSSTTKHQDMFTWFGHVSHRSGWPRYDTSVLVPKQCIGQFCYVRVLWMAKYFCTTVRLGWTSSWSHLGHTMQLNWHIRTGLSINSQRMKSKACITDLEDTEFKRSLEAASMEKYNVHIKWNLGKEVAFHWLLEIPSLDKPWKPNYQDYISFKDKRTQFQKCPISLFYAARLKPRGWHWHYAFKLTN